MYLLSTSCYTVSLSRFIFSSHIFACMLNVYYPQWRLYRNFIIARGRLTWYEWVEIDSCESVFSSCTPSNSTHLLWWTQNLKLHFINHHRNNCHLNTTQVMDGLTRRELEFVPLRVKRSISRALEDKDESIRAYVVGGRNVLKSWVSGRHLHD